MIYFPGDTEGAVVLHCGWEEENSGTALQKRGSTAKSACWPDVQSVRGGDKGVTLQTCFASCAAAGEPEGRWLVRERAGMPPQSVRWHERWSAGLRSPTVAWR